MDLTEEQWNVVQAILPADPVVPTDEAIHETIAGTFSTASLDLAHRGPWKDPPRRYGAYQTVHQRFQNCVRQGVMEAFLLAIAQDLKDRGGLDLRECFVDGTFVPAKKGALWSAKPSAGKAAKSWPLQSAMIFLWLCVQAMLRRLR